MRRFIVSVVMLFGLAASAGDFVTGNPSLPPQKVDKIPPPADTTRYIVAADVNNLWGAAFDLRTSVVGLTTAIYRQANICDYESPCPGLTDDNAGITGAIAALPSGGKILLPAGSFKFNLSTIKGGLVISGAGSGNVNTGLGGTVISPADPSKPIFQFGDGISTTSRGNKLENVLLLGDGLNATGDGIYLFGARDFRTDNVTITAMGRDGIRIQCNTMSSSGLRFLFTDVAGSREANLRAENCSAGPSGFTSDIKIIGSHFNSFTSPAVSLYLDSVVIGTVSSYFDLLDGAGVKMVKNFSTTPGIEAYDTNFDNASGSTAISMDVSAVYAASARLASAINGSFRFNGQVIYSDATVNESQSRGAALYQPWFLNAMAFNSLKFPLDETDTSTGCSLSRVNATGSNIEALVMGNCALRTIGTFTYPIQFGSGQASLWRDGSGMLRYRKDARNPSADTNGVMISPVLVSPTYGTNVTIDTSLGNVFNITATNGTAFTILNPSNAQVSTAQSLIDICIINSSGGQLGIITWSGNYAFVPGETLSLPSNGVRKCVQFRLDSGGTTWFETWRSSPFQSIVSVKDFGATSSSTSTQVGTAVAAACASLSGGKGTVWIPSDIPAGTTSPLANGCQIFDLRGGTSTWGGTAFVSGLELANRWTSVGAGLQLPQALHFDVDAYSGGVNEYPTGLAQKTQWTMLRGGLNYRTIGERKSIIVEMECQAKGDCANYFGINYDFGGYGTGGDEGSLGNRLWIHQGLGDGTTFPTGTVASASGSSVTGTWTSSTNHHLGEQRPIINTSRNVYSTGTISTTSAGSPCTVTGAGTSWSTLTTGAHSDLFLEITGNTNGTMKWVVPITSITDDTHLVIEYNLNEFGATCLGSTMTKTGTYNIYHGANVLSLGTPVASSTDTNTVNFSISSSMFTAGDTIQQPVGYNWTPRGYHARMNRFIGEPNGVGLTIGTDNYTPPPGQAYSFESGIRLEDNFQYAIRAGLGHNGFVDGLHFGSPVSNSLIMQTDFSAAQQTLFYLLGPGGSGARQFLYSRTSDYFWFSGGQYFSGSDSRVGFGTTPQSNVAQYMFYNNAAWAGLKIEPQTSPNANVPILAVEVAGVPRFRVEDSRTFVNNGSDFVVFKDNSGTQAAKIEGSTGKVIPGSSTFANLGTGSTVNGTFLYCSDCIVANPCAGGGTGAIAQRLNGAWSCGSSATGLTSGRKSFYYQLLNSIDVSYSVASSPVSVYGGGSKTANPLTTRSAVLMGVGASVAVTDGYITTAVVTRPGWAPKATTIVRPQTSANIIHWWSLDTNSGDAAIGGGATQKTFSVGGAASTTPFAGIYQDARGSNGSNWLCCSGDGANYSCIDSGVTISGGTDYTLVIDLSLAGTLSCAVNATTVSKSTNLPGSTADLKINWGAMNNIAAATSGPIWSDVTLEENSK